VSQVTKKFKRDLIPEKCEIPGCEYTVFITRHRIKPGRIDGKYIPGNVIGLCPNHHAEAELGLITKYELFAIVQDRLKRTIKSKGVNNNGYFAGFNGYNQDLQQVQARFAGLTIYS
jgi:hypothetical protein